MFEVMDFWLDMGVDGLRLDAVPYLYEREGTNCENLPETHAFLKELRAHVDAKYKDRMLLAEANQWPEDAVAYFGDGRRVPHGLPFPAHAAAVHGPAHGGPLSRSSTSCEQTPADPGQLPVGAVPAQPRRADAGDGDRRRARLHVPRLRPATARMRINLGIRRRLAPLLENDRRRIELMNALLFSLPGTPVIYYGDEIGMGDNIYLGDRNGVRTPMQWSADRNAGFSRANPQRLYLPVEHRPRIPLRGGQRRGAAEQPALAAVVDEAPDRAAQAVPRLWPRQPGVLFPSNRRVLAFVRRYEDEIVLVVANLSRFAQCAELDLSGFRGLVPVEVFGSTRFPPVTDKPYFLSLGPHAFFWLHLAPAAVSEEALTTGSDFGAHTGDRG